MKIETKFNPQDIIYFLTSERDYRDTEDHNLKTGEVFVCKGEVHKININGTFDGKYDIEYVVYIRAYGQGRRINIHEDMCAANIPQLGLNVSNYYYISEKK